MSRVKEIDLQQMGPLRNASQKKSQLLEKKLNGHLVTLTPLFTPRKILGEFMESAFKDKILGAEANFKNIDEQFKDISRNGFKMPMKLSTPVAGIKNTLEIYSWQYLYPIGGNAEQTITVSSPTRWVLCYASGLNLSRLLKAKIEGETLRGDDVKELLLNSLVLVTLLNKFPGIKNLFEDLRFSITIEKSQVSGELPYVVLNSPLSAFRPQDDIIQTVTQLSGLPMFEELIDLDGMDNLDDPFMAAVADVKDE
ncbi:MAG: hypothetical protein GXP08_12180 [Gammaproteobacteria bacterium]|nr:hypothetical protein [Gammaproteobacteria bacterium]